MFNELKVPRLHRTVVFAVALGCFVLLASSALAATTYKRYEALSNCDGGGGWLVESSSNGSTTLTILCDGGTLVQP